MKIICIILGAIIIGAVIMAFPILLPLSILFKWPPIVIFILSVASTIEYIILVMSISIYAGKEEGK